MDDDTAGVVHTGVRAAQHGFRFGNRFVYTLPWRRLGGALGLCGGMCLAAADYAAAGTPAPQMSEPPAWGAPLQRYLLRRQLDSWRYGCAGLRTLFWMALSDADVVRRTLEQELPKVLAGLEQGAPQLLVLMRATGWDPRENHQVLATGYERDHGGELVTLYAYDPNHQGREVALWADATGQAIPPVAQSTGEALRGFFVVPYRLHRPPQMDNQPDKRGKSA